MTGIERLRALAYKKNFLEPAEARELDAIADQIEREQNEDAKAIAWVRDHGGLERVKQQRRESMPRAFYERKRRGWLDHIAECETALGKRREAIARLASENDALSLECAQMRPRLMPEGMEWPRYESGELVMLGDTVTKYVGGGTIKVRSVEFLENMTYLHERFKTDQIAIVRPGERVKRPEPKVLDADGAEIREKCDAWWICEGDERGVHAERLRVETIGPNGLIECSPYNGRTWVYLEPSELYVNKPVPAADGKPLREGETVYHVADGRACVVREVREGGAVVEPVDGRPCGRCRADYLTHERPEVDSWERLEEDARMSPSNYCLARGLEDTGATYGDAAHAMARDLVRRARALAGGV